MPTCAATCGTTSSSGATAERGFGHWALMQRDEEALIGFCGLKPMDDPAEVELMYGLLPVYWGAGLATEAAAAWLHAGFTHLGLPRIWGLTDTPNAGSQAVMRRLGMRFVERAPIHGLDSVLYVIAPADRTPLPSGLRIATDA
ncbi:MAG: GNAT family N-acetyltransferase [Candidatus Binatia bacterium]